MSRQGYSPHFSNHILYDFRDDTITLTSGYQFPRPTDIPPESLFTAQNNAPLTTVNRRGSIQSPPAQSLTDQLSELNVASEQATSSRRIPVHVDPRTQPEPPKYAGKASTRVLSDVSNKQATKKSFQDERSGVKAIVQPYPNDDLIPKELRQKGVTTNSLLYGTEEPHERLWPEYKIRSKPRNFFVVGRVFSVLWPEPAGNSVVSRQTVVDRMGQPIFSKIRRFVVIRSGQNYCTGLAISTYGGRGVSAPAVDKSEHVIIYTGKKCPNIKRAELPKRLGEGGMRPPAVQVISDKPTEKLDEMSRLNLASVHTIQHNIKVRNFGLVSKKSLPYLSSHFKNVWKMKNSSSKKGNKSAKAEDTSTDEASESDSQDENEASDGRASDEEGADREKSKGKARAKDDDDDDEDEEEDDGREEEDEDEDDEEDAECNDDDDDDDEGSDDSDP